MDLAPYFLSFSSLQFCALGRANVPPNCAERKGEDRRHHGEMLKWIFGYLYIMFAVLSFALFYTLFGLVVIAPFVLVYWVVKKVVAWLTQDT